MERSGIPVDNSKFSTFSTVFSTGVFHSRCGLWICIFGSHKKLRQGSTDFPLFRGLWILPREAICAKNQDLTPGIFPAAALQGPPLWGGWHGASRDGRGCGTRMRMIVHLSEYALLHSLFRPRFRSATFPKGEGIGAPAPEGITAAGKIPSRVSEGRQAVYRTRTAPR